MGLLEMIGDNMVSNIEAQHLAFHAVKVGHTPAQLAILTSLMTVYPPVFAGPNEGQRTEHHFGALKTFVDYSRKNGHDRLYYVLRDGLATRVQTLQCITNALLSGHQFVMLFYATMIHQVTGFATLLLLRLVTFYKEMVNYATEVGNDHSPSVQFKS